MSQGNIRVRTADVPSNLDLVFTHSGLETRNIIYGPPVGKSDHLVLEFDYTVKQEVLKDKKIIQNKKYTEGNYVA